MPHISVKMLKGRTTEQKQIIAKALSNALVDALNVDAKYISLTIEDYTAKEWQDVYKQEIDNKADSLYVAPCYKPEDLL